MKWFRGCTTAEEVKARYHELLMKHHPDNGGDVATCQEINAEFKEVFGRLKNIHRSAEGETYTKETAETAEEFMDILEKVIHFTGCRIEIIGSWVWISGNTKPYKDILKQEHFGWSHNKQAWYYHKEPYKKRNKNKYSMNDIRGMWGSKDIDPEPQPELT